MGVTKEVIDVTCVASQPIITSSQQSHSFALISMAALIMDPLLPLLDWHEREIFEGATQASDGHASAGLPLGSRIAPQRRSDCTLTPTIRMVEPLRLGGLLLIRGLILTPDFLPKCRAPRLFRLRRQPEHRNDEEPPATVS